MWITRNNLFLEISPLQHAEGFVEDSKKEKRVLIEGAPQCDYSYCDLYDTAFLMSSFMKSISLPIRAYSKPSLCPVFYISQANMLKINISKL
jgi:hypothetical protein